MSGTLRIAAMGDVHCTVRSAGALQPVFTAAGEAADVLVLCGDLTDYGLADEARVLVNELQGASVPVVAVLGNHDFESGTPDDVKTILVDAGIHVLDGDTYEVGGVGFAGVKGFAGGFGRRALEPWGEPAIKQFVDESVSETLKLESALARLRTPQKIVVLHYAPIEDTVVNEPVEIYAFLGSSRLAEPIDRYEATMALHGHAHYGSPEGRTAGGVPVYNVSMPLLRKHFPNDPPFRLIEVPVEAAEDVAAAGPSL